MENRLERIEEQWEVVLGHNTRKGRAMKFNTMLDVAFSVDHDFEDVHDLIKTPKGVEMVLSALRRRVKLLSDSLDECADAFGICDTYRHD